MARFGVHYEVLTEAKANLIALANRTGRYAAYKMTTAQLGDPLVEMTPYRTYASEPDAAEKALLTAGGYTLLDLNGHPSQANPSGIGVFFGRFFDPTSGNLSSWVADMNSGLRENKSELYPFHQVQIMDVNPGLVGQQHPAYQ